MRIKIVFLFLFALLISPAVIFAVDLKKASCAGSFYPADKEQLQRTIDGFLSSAVPEPPNVRPFAVICPHAGYVYSGPTAACSYKLIKDKLYKTVVIIGCSHRAAFDGIRVYNGPGLRTPLGDVLTDAGFCFELLGKDGRISAGEQAFDGEHCIEVQLPFLQRALKQFRIVPVLMGNVDLADCRRLAALLREAVAKRDDVLLVLSSDMCHSYDYEETQTADKKTLGAIEKMDPESLYNGLEEGSVQLCGGPAVVTGMLLAREMGYGKARVLKYTNSAEVTGIRQKGSWTVGYCAVFFGSGDNQKEGPMFTKEQKKELLRIARESINFFLEKGARMQLNGGSYPAFQEKLGAFVTLRKDGQLRGCIGNMVGIQPLYLTIRDMAVEAAANDPRFEALSLDEFKNVQIEISVLSPLEKVASAEDIMMGKHGVMVRNGFRSGVFLPQVATETGWRREEFLNTLCRQKAGLPAGAWKNKETQLYVFTAEVFSENE